MPGFGRALFCVITENQYNAGMKKLYRSDNNKVIAGVVGGIGEYFDVDPVILRLITIVFFVFTGFFPVAIVYVLAIFVIPKESETVRVVDVEEETKE